MIRRLPLAVAFAAVLVLTMLGPLSVANQTLSVSAQADSACSQRAVLNIDPSSIQLGDIVSNTLAVHSSCPDARLHLVFVIDKSGSMDRDLPDVQRQLGRAVDNLDLTTTWVGVVEFAEEARFTCRLLNDARQIKLCINNIRDPFNKSKPEVGIKKAGELLASGRNSDAPASEAIFVITDARRDDMRSCGASEAAARELTDIGVTFATSCIGGDCQTCMRGIATAPELYTDFDRFRPTTFFDPLKPEAIAVTSAAITVTLPSNMTYVADSSNPPANFEANTLSWALTGSDPVTTTWKVEPLEVGTHSVAANIKCQFTDTVGNSGLCTSNKSPEIEVRPAPTTEVTPTVTLSPTSTPTATDTPVPTSTPISTPTWTQWNILLPIVIRTMDSTATSHQLQR